MDLARELAGQGLLGIICVLLIYACRALYLAKNAAEQARIDDNQASTKVILSLLEKVLPAIEKLDDGTKALGDATARLEQERWTAQAKSPPRTGSR